MTEPDVRRSALDELKTRVTDLSAQGLAEAVSRGIRDGAFEPGAELPPVRAVAASLGLARGTVSSAWAALSRAGMIYTDGRHGTKIADGGAATEPVRSRRALQYSARFHYDLSVHLPDPALLPDLGPALGRLAGAPVETHLDGRILPELLDHLRSDWPFGVDHITVADGLMESLQLVVSTLLRFGDRVAVEHPNDPPLLDFLESRGLRLVPIDMDREGPSPASLAAAVKAGVRAVFFQPRAHQPTAISMTRDRATQLTHILRNSDTQIIEVDFLWAIASAPLHTFGQVIPERTIHIRGYAASCGPEVRIAAIGGPADVMDALVLRRLYGQGWTSRLLQRLLFELLTDTAALGRIEMARAEYGRRRRALVAELANRQISVGGTEGKYVWLPVEDEAGALATLTRRRIGVAPGTPFAVRPDLDPHLAVAASLLPVEHAPQIAAALAAAARVNRPARRTRP
jgi:DNA-binding transcriptional MocR family regulator